ncbi:MAG: molybdopterin-synthase adenylyltransferase MoeB [Nostocoides sp.]
MATSPLVAPGPPLTVAERHRYARHLTLSAIGEEGQRRLRAARVLVVGAGGLGSPALLYLAAAGIGTIGIVDDDVVDATNLQRQVAHRAQDVGRLKTSSAADAVARINPDVFVIEHRERLRADNAAGLVAAYDVVVDGADNFGTRYLVNDACALAGIPDVWGSVLAFDGQVSVWWAGHGPCYRCVFPEPPPDGSVASCSSAGVLGAMCGVVAAMQVTEVVKLVTGSGEPLVGRLVVHDALGASTASLQLTRDPGCPVCGDAPTITTLVEVADCSRPVEVADRGPRLTATELAALLQSPDAPALVDVREASERARGMIAGSVHVPMAAFRQQSYAALLPAGVPLVLYCAGGMRSATAGRILGAAGYAVRDLEGGILAWRAAGLPLVRADG